MGSTASSSKPSAEVAQLVKNFISSNSVAVFSKTYCPYCTSAKNAIGKITEFGLIELDEVENGAAIQAYLQQLTGQRTVPNVFIKGTHVGGCDNSLAAIKNGSFQKALNGDSVFPQVKL